MPDYDLSGLSPRSFERLIQAIAGKVLGQGTITFGDGPDGGREATFEGRMDYPSKTGPWQGYCVIQAKFLQRPKDTTSDGRWAIKQLEGELRAFADTKKRRRVPHYYIFVTNIVLTPVQTRGGKDKAAGIFRKYRERVPLRGWAIWDHDEISKFLDMFADIRQTYAGWVTAGDVLSEVIQQFGASREHFLEIVTNFLAKELRNDQFANLEQAGHSMEQRIPLARVFVDLPTTTQRTSEPPTEDGRHGVEIIELVAALMEEGKERLDPASIQRGEVISEGRPARPQKAQPGRYVLVGGPGQGKTTVGQFACQLFRAALLCDRPPHSLPPEVKEPHAAILEQCRTGTIALPAARRFPVQVALSEFAAALNAHHDLTLLAFLAKQIERRTGLAVSLVDLRKWLSTYPWFLVLDGLDEVPSSTNREELVKRVEDFWIDAAQVNADVLVLATTRPQGYNNDFSPAHYRHLWLAPLSPKRAMDYAQRLVEVRFAGEPDRKRKVLNRLREASKQEATVRLMRSPLQITIMAALVDQTGTPPQDRWRLFHEYYEVIYNREKERAIPAAELLRDHKPDIDAIHHQVGLILQVESERAGGTETKVPATQFAKLVTARLEEEGFSGPALVELRDRIIDAAANRIVFLVGLEAGQVGFEIRSLQEYMAAEAIMTGTQNTIQERLRRFAPIVSWRNVFLFAAGRCFLQEQHLRDTIHTICVELNDQLAGPVAKAALAGSILALDLLEDGIARRQPKYARLLAQCAVRLLELPPSEDHARLSDVCEGEIEIVLREDLERKIGIRSSGSLAAWATLMALTERGLGWASELGNRCWPEDPRQQLAIISLPTVERGTTWLNSRIASVLKTNPPHAAWGYSNLYLRRQLLHHPLQTRDFTRLPSLRREMELKLDLFGLEMSFGLTPIDTARSIALAMDLDDEGVHPGWLPVIEEIKFSQAPSMQALADGLQRIASKEESFQPVPFSAEVSWVFGSLLASARSPAELRNIAKRAAEGDFGDVSDWLDAERRWREEGVSLEDLKYLTDERWPFDRRIATRGFPVVGAWRGIMLSARPSSAVPSLLQFLASLKGASNLQRVLVPLFFFAFGDYDRNSPPPGLTPERFMDLLRLHGQYGLDASVAWLIAKLAIDNTRWLDILDQVGQTLRLLERLHEPDVRRFIRLFSMNPDRPGLLPLIVSALHEFPVSEILGFNLRHFEAFENPRIRWAAVVLELVQGALDRERANRLAEVTTDLRLQGIADLKDVRAACGRLERIDESTFEFLTKLQQHLSDEEWQDGAALTAILNDALRRLNSGVTRPEVWHSLALPAKLLDLVGTSK